MKINAIQALVMHFVWLIFVDLGLLMMFTYNYLDIITLIILAQMTSSVNFLDRPSLMGDEILEYLNKYLAMPLLRESTFAGRIALIVMRNLIQMTVILAIVFLVKAPILQSLPISEMYLILFVLGEMILAFSTKIALYLEKHDSHATTQTFTLMPLSTQFIISRALMPCSAVPEWFTVRSHADLVNYVIDAFYDLHSADCSMYCIGDRWI
jgi:ABC-2 type transport system permease protein